MLLEAPRDAMARRTLVDLVRAPHVAEHLADGALLVIPYTGDLLALNSTAATILRDLSIARPPHAIATSLAKHFNISENQAIADVDAFLAHDQRKNASLAGIGLEDDSPFRFEASTGGFTVKRDERVCLEIGRDGHSLTILPGVSATDAREAVFWVTAKMAVLQGIPVFHASAVRSGEGRAIAFAGRSGAGKTTLARAFTQVGAAPLCEDSCTLLLDPADGVVRLAPFERSAAAWADRIMSVAVRGRPLPVVLPTPDGTAAIPVDRILIVDRGRRTGQDLVASRLGPTAAAGALIVNFFWASLERAACERGAAWAATLAKRVTVEDLTAPAGVDQIAPAARRFLDTYAI